MLPVDLPGTVRDALLAPLVDHHCHGVRRDDLSRAAFELLVNEGGSPAPPGTTHFDTAFGMAVRRWCAPVLDLEPHAPPAVYVSRREELGAAEVNRRLLAGAGVVAFLVDGGADGVGDADLLTATEMGRHGGAAADELVRVERIERAVAESAPLAVDYLDGLGDALAARAAKAVAFKSVAGALCGLDFDPARPSRGSVIAAANRRLSDPKRPLTDEVLLRHLLWSAVDAARERGLPLQLHAGFRPAAPGETSLPWVDLHRADPGRLNEFAGLVQPLGVPIVLLHCYPYHRQAAYLASLHPHVYVDAGLAPPHAAAASARVMAELLELAPFHKLLYGSACHGVAETGYLGALHYRQALGAALGARLAAGEWSPADAARVAHMIGSGNARRVYRL
ncbi:amidohydrolase family protein [Nonomuraea phyllanthi]|uniref:Amidohydrolase family protein n=1 Tax=Nonomuraea phyllanthi TaxID=2219224 RepID=A0A5C4WK42_9ACTN|nr:amidohydrolase family protein [Nonomuraea phyllanthi]KAB8194524.1 amidohydrolase family protein [Nonomuraea phyllanthi]QFY08950.1 amidohydrolase family protein [Nonomuraea phyllanthi]